MAFYNAGRHQNDCRDFGRCLERIKVIVDGRFRFSYEDTDLHRVLEETGSISGRVEVWLLFERGAVLFKRTLGRQVIAA
jgi:hypothetical protein